MLHLSIKICLARPQFMKERVFNSKYQCQICPLKFVQKGDAYKHLELDHGVKTHIYTSSPYMQNLSKI